MKKILVIFLILLLCGCENKASYYKEVSDVVVDLFKDTSYLKGNLDENQIKLIDNYINSIKAIKTKVGGNSSMDRVLYLEENANIVNVNNEGNVRALNKGTTSIASMTVNGIIEKVKIIVE